MHSENFTCVWISAVIFPTFISHTYSGLVVCNSTRPVSLILYSHSASHTCIMRVLGHTDGSQDSPSGNQQPRPQNLHYTCVLFCPRIIFYWRNVTAYIKTWLLRIFQEMFLKCFMALFWMRRIKGSAKTTTSLFRSSQGLMAYALR